MESIFLYIKIDPGQGASCRPTGDEPRGRTCTRADWLELGSYTLAPSLKISVKRAQSVSPNPQFLRLEPKDLEIKLPASGIQSSLFYRHCPSLPKPGSTAKEDGGEPTFWGHVPANAHRPYRLCSGKRAKPRRERLFSQKDLSRSPDSKMNSCGQRQHRDSASGGSQFGGN